MTEVVAPVAWKASLNGVEHRDTFDFGAAFARGYAADDFGAVGDHALGVGGAHLCLSRPGR